MRYPPPDEAAAIRTLLCQGLTVDHLVGLLAMRHDITTARAKVDAVLADLRAQAREDSRMDTYPYPTIG